jgi:toxin ParE1/3/4
MHEKVKFEILPEADDELRAAAIWYEERRAGLGLDLITEFRERLALALRLPGVGASLGYTDAGEEIRRYRLRRFARYAIVIARIHDVPTVLAVAHSSRRPGYWRDRLA